MSVTLKPDLSAGGDPRAEAKPRRATIQVKSETSAVPLDEGMGLDGSTSRPRRRRAGMDAEPSYAVGRGSPSNGRGWGVGWGGERGRGAELAKRRTTSGAGAGWRCGVRLGRHRNEADCFSLPSGVGINRKMAQLRGGGSPQTSSYSGAYFTRLFVGWGGVLVQSQGGLSESE